MRNPWKHAHIPTSAAWDGGEESQEGIVEHSPGGHFRRRERSAENPAVVSAVELRKHRGFVEAVCEPSLRFH